MIDMIGQKFGKLTVLEECEERSKDRQKIYLCECECGSTSVVRGGCLRGGKTKSCGCITKTVNGLSHDPLYRRCYKAYERTHSDGKDYHKTYQDKGVEYNFGNAMEMYEYLLPLWNEAIKEHEIDLNLQIDRIDNSVGYEPGNLRITTRTINNRNRDTTLHVAVTNIRTGEVVENVILKEFCDERGLDYKTLHARLRRKVKNPVTDGWVVRECEAIKKAWKHNKA